MSRWLTSHAKSSQSSCCSPITTLSTTTSSSMGSGLRQKSMERKKASGQESCLQPRGWSFLFREEKQGQPFYPPLFLFFCMYKHIAKSYNELHQEEQLKKLAIIKQNIKIIPPLLDIGCGTGISTNYFAELIGMQGVDKGNAESWTHRVHKGNAGSPY